ncbi:MAG: type II secretion system GspH family protein [Thermodesulfovibrio sp.]|nr:type II secretion system GspH family protein [Thermodesulfovibrio sp.]MDW7972888.1 type II secretion system protein [Thermodesulfovibrio sp.]
MKKGYSILEILIVIALIGIVTTGILSAYRFIAKENVSGHFVAKQESDAVVLINQLIKDIESAGFGIDIDNLTLTTIGSASVRFPSLASREEIWSGCWGFLRNGILTTSSKNFMGKNCEFPNAWYTVLDPLTKKNLCPSSLEYLCNDLTGMSGVAFFATTNNDYRYPQSFMITYNLTQTNLPKECAQGTYNLVKTVGTARYAGYQANQPVVSCILQNGFKIRAGIQRGASIVYQDSLSSSDIQNYNLKLFRLCLIIQVGGIQDTATTTPRFSSDCGGGPSIDSTWWNNTGRWYRWKVIEQDIHLRNYQ